MSKTRIPDRGDIVWVDFDPVRGTEQSGRRPALVLTDWTFHNLYPRSIVCPIISNAMPWPTKVVLPTSMGTQGAVLADQPRTVTRLERSFRFIERAPSDVVSQTRAIVASLIGITL